MIEGSASSSRTIALYLIAVIFAGGLLIGAGLYAEHVAAGTHWQVTLLEPEQVTLPPDTERDAAPTRLQLAVENAREIRAALAKPLPPPEPLQPITAKLTRGRLLPGHKAAHTVKAPAPAAADKAHKLPPAALHAMASAKMEKPAPAPAPSPVDIHRVY